MTIAPRATQSQLGAVTVIMLALGACANENKQATPDGGEPKASVIDGSDAGPAEPSADAGSSADPGMAAGRSGASGAAAAGRGGGTGGRGGGTSGRAGESGAAAGLGGRDPSSSGQGASGRGGQAAAGAGGNAATGGNGGASGSDPSISAGVRFLGRYDNTTDPGRPRFAWSGSGFVASFTGKGLVAQLDNDDAFMFQVVIDGMRQPQPLIVNSGQGSYMLASNLQAVAHTLEFYRQTEGIQGNSQLLDLSVTEGSLNAPPAAKARLIEVVGNSISCGYGDLGDSADCGFSYATESHYDSYEAVIGRALNAEISTVAVSGHGLYRNGDDSMDDTLPKLYERVLAADANPKWDFHVEPQALIVELGTNDFAGGVPGAGFRTAYLDFVRVIRTKYPHVLIVCTIGPMMSDSYPSGQMQLTTIRGYVQAVVDMRKSAGDPAIEMFEFTMNEDADFGCDYHPNALKHAQMGNALAAWLRTKLGW